MAPAHKSEEALEMKKELGIGLTFLASFALAGALCVLTPASGKAQAATATSAQTPAAAQSVSGKIASVEKSSFTLTVGSEQKSNVSEHFQTPPPASQTASKSMTFQVDQNTTIDGKLKVGANADVTYRQEGGNNIAISVRVS
jgi:hypothetical protein